MSVPTAVLLIVGISFIFSFKFHDAVENGQFLSLPFFQIFFAYSMLIALASSPLQ